MNEQMRKEFEAFAKPHTYSLKMIDGEYAAASTALLWQCWQASRQALVVELPDWDDYDTTRQYMDAVTHKLIQLGVEVK